MKKLFTFLLIALFAINSCGPTLESENEGWQENLDAMAKLKTDYPAFTALIDKKIEEAKTIWDEAQSISDEEQKLDKMVAANDVLERGTMGNLKNMKSKISSLKSKKESLMKMKTDLGEKRAVFNNRNSKIKIFIGLLQPLTNYLWINHKELALL